MEKVNTPTQTPTHPINWSNLGIHPSKQATATKNGVFELVVEGGGGGGGGSNFKKATKSAPSGTPFVSNKQLLSMG